MGLVDKRFAGIARGVSTGAILGRVDPRKSKSVACSYLAVLRLWRGRMLILLVGLDMLERHQACIDPSKEKLIIQGVDVLGEADMPKNMEKERAEEPKVAGPRGTKIGARSGAVSGPSSGHSVTPIAPQPASQSSLPAESINQLVALGFWTRL